MSADTRDTILAVVAVLGFLAACVAGMWRLWLKPFLQRELFGPVQEARKNVAENHHSNEKPTLPDRIDDMTKAMEAGFAKVHRRIDGVETNLGGKFDTLDEKVDGHLISSSAVDAGQAARMTAAEQRLDRLER